MADPGMLATIGMVGAGAGGVMGALSSIMGGDSQSSMYRYKAGIARQNAQIAKQNADYARKVGEVEAQRKGMETRFEIGQQKVGQAASGLDVNTGSAERVRDSTQAIGAHDQAVIRANSARKAYGYEVEGAQAEAESGMMEAASTSSKKAGYLGAVSSILGGATSVASKWLQYKQNFGSSTSSDDFTGSDESYLYS
jgi:hypothetical protein